MPMNHFPVSPASRRFAKSMRSTMTDAELKLWNELRAKRLMDLAFRRQMPIAGHIVDFACPAKRLIVELDGLQHSKDDGVSKDSARTRNLEALGWTVLRFWNDDVIRDIDGVCMHICNVAGAVNPAMQEP
jgi:very-short-patch-repair endonuclease